MTDGPTRRSRPWTSPASLVAALSGAAVVILARLWLSRGKRFYGIWPDEPAQLAIARLVGGAARWNMNNHNTWRPAYGTLLGAVYAVTDDPTTVFRTGLVINAVLGGVSFVLLFVLARRLTPLTPLPAAAVAALVSLAPALLFTTQYVWSESLTQPLYLGALLAILWFDDRPTAVRGVVAGVVAVAGFLAHSRVLPLAVVVAVVAIVNVRRRRCTVRDAAIVVAATALAFVAASLYSSWVVDQLWNVPSTRNSYSAVFEQARKLPDTLVSIAGQSWYLLVTTAGLAGLGIAVLISSVRRGRRDDQPPTRSDAFIVLACVGALAALSMVFMAGETRPDRIVYGRYNDAVFAPVTVLGIASLVTCRRLNTLLLRLATVATVGVGLGIVITLARDDELRSGGIVRPMILGLQSFLGRGKAIDAPGFSVAFAVLVVIVAIALVVAHLAGWRPGVLVALAAFVVVGFVRTDDALNRNRGSTPVTQSIGALAGDDVLGGRSVTYLLNSNSNDTGRMMAYQFYLPSTRFEVVDPDDFAAATSPTPFVVAREDDEALTAAGAAVLWDDPAGELVIWVLPGETQDSLLQTGRLADVPVASAAPG